MQSGFVHALFVASRQLQASISLWKVGRPASFAVIAMVRRISWQAVSSVHPQNRHCSGCRYCPRRFAGRFMA